MRNYRVRKPNGIVMTPPKVELRIPEGIEIPIAPEELDLLDDCLDEVVAYVVKHGKIENE